MDIYILRHYLWVVVDIREGLIVYVEGSVAYIGSLFRWVIINEWLVWK